MHISNRLLNVLKYLEQNNSTYIRSISKDLDISERMVRYDINTLNYLFNLNNISKIEKGTKGRLEFDQELVGSSKLKEIHKIKKTSKKERVELIKAKLLIEGKLNLTLLTDELEVSRTSIRKDLQEVVTVLKQNEVKSNSNLLLEKDEDKIRSTLLRMYGEKIRNFLLKEESLDEESLVDLYLLSYFEKLDLKRLKAAIKSFINKNAKQRHYMEVFLYLVVAYLRISNGNYLERKKHKTDITATKNLDIVTFLDEIEGSLGVNLGGLEKEEFKGFLIGLFSPDHNKCVTKNWFEIVLITKKIIQQIGNRSKVDLEKDIVLLDGLLEHLKSTIIRLKYKGGMEDNIYTEVIGPYPELFKSFKELLKPLEKILKLSLPSSEITLIIIHFLAALERNNEQTKKRILMVCGGGFGTSNLIAKKIIDLYHIEIVGNINYTEFKEYDFKNIDVVITTLNIKIYKNKTIPLLQVSPLLTSSDKDNLNNYLFKKNYNGDKLHEVLNMINENTDIKDRDKLAENLEKSLDVKLDKHFKNLFEYRLTDWISKESIEIVENAKDWEESIKKSGKILIKNDCVEEEYIKNIIKITKEVGVHYLLTNGVAIPHGEVGNHVKKSAISLLIVKNGVYFPNEPRTNIFFLIAAKGTKDHIRSIEDILTLSKDKTKVQKIIQSETVEEVYKVLKSIKY